jgi:hypothetical protein
VLATASYTSRCGGLRVLKRPVTGVHRYQLAAYVIHSSQYKQPAFLLPPRHHALAGGWLPSSHCFYLIFLHRHHLELPFAPIPVLIRSSATSSSSPSSGSKTLPPLTQIWPYHLSYILASSCRHPPCPGIHATGVVLRQTALVRIGTSTNIGLV